MRLHRSVESAFLASTSHHLSFPPFPRLPSSWGNVFGRVVLKLIEANERAQDRRRLDDMPEWLRADAGLPLRSHAERSMKELSLLAALIAQR